MLHDLLIQPLFEFGFMRRALVACLALSVSAGPIGVFLVLRRMSLMGDAMSHAILPGAAVGFLLSGLSLWAMSVGGLVAAPVWRWLPHRHREHAIALIVMAVWLVAWGEIENRLGTVNHALSAWTFADELIDIVRWVGWIPFVLLLCGRGGEPAPPNPVPRQSPR